MQAIPLSNVTMLGPDGTPTIIGDNGGGTGVPTIPLNPPFVAPVIITMPPPAVPAPPILIEPVTLADTSSFIPTGTLPTTTPNITLVTPYEDPPGTTRIYKTEDAYQIFPSNLSSYIYSYAVGTPTLEGQASFTVKNLCTQHTLGVTINLPQFLTTTVGSTFLLPPLETQSIDLTVDETGSINLIEQRKETYTEPIVISVEVLNITGPVYIQAPTIVLPQPILARQTITNANGDIFTIPAGLPLAKRNLLLSQSLEPNILTTT